LASVFSYTVRKGFLLVSLGAVGW